MTTAIFITISNYKTPQLLNLRHLVFPCTGADTKADSSQITQGGGSKIRRSCQSTIVGAVCAELRHSDRNLRTAWFEREDFKVGIKKTGCYHYRMDVYTHFQHTFMVKQLVKWILHPMTPLSHKPSTVYKWKQSKTVLNKYVGRFRCERTTGSEIFHWYYYVRIMEWSFGQKWWGLKLTPHGWIFFLTNTAFHFTRNVLIYWS